MVEKNYQLEGKPALRKLTESDSYLRKKEVLVYDVWDIVTPNGRGPDTVLQANLYGTQEAVTRFAQEAYGDFNGPFSHSWSLQPSKINFPNVVSVIEILRDLNIEPISIPDPRPKR